MKRYSSTRRKRDKSNITSYTTTMYPSIPIENSDKLSMSWDAARYKISQIRMNI